LVLDVDVDLVLDLVFDLVLVQRWSGFTSSFRSV
jgi:hypothetical protein